MKSSNQIQISPDLAPFTKTYSTFPRIFALFGLDLCRSGAPKWPRRVAFLVLKMAAVVLVLANAYCLNLKSNTKARTPPKKVLLNFNIRTELSDLIFAIFALLAMFVHEKSLAQLFSRAVFPITQSKRVRILMAFLVALWVIFALAMPGVSLLGKSLTDVAVAMATGKFKVVVQIFMPITLHVFSNLFCGLYALVCISLLHQLANLDRKSIHSLEDLEKRHRAVRLTASLLEKSFSGVLPLLYAARLGAFVVWTEFTLNELGTSKEIKFRRPYLVLQLVQAACLVIPPIFVNAMLESSLDIELKDEDEKKLFMGAYTASQYTNNASISPRVQLWAMQMATNSKRLTAGGVTISAWLIAKGVGCSIIVVWLSHNFKLLIEEIKKLAPK